MASIYETHKPPAGGGGQYLKLGDGDTVKVRIASEPAIFETENEGDNGEVRISTRYAWVVWNQDEQAAQIMQQSATFFKSIANLAQDEDWGDPTGYDIKITRKGQRTDTTYLVTPTNNKSPLSTEAKAAIAAIDLLEKLKASPYASHVFMLADFDKPATKATKAKVADTAGTHPDSKGISLDSLGGEEVDLDNIPF